METVTRFVDRQAGFASVASPPSADAARTLTATASYLLSEDGRKASLLSGGDGRSVQQISLHVPSNRLHLVSVDRQGVARLKLRPRFEMDATGIVRIDTAPMYDAPPTIDELYRAAAKNHELEAAYFTQRTALRTKRADDDRGRRQTVAEAFLADKAMRAASHPPPTPKTCYVITERGGVLFDVSIDQGLAKDVPPRPIVVSAPTGVPIRSRCDRTRSRRPRCTSKRSSSSPSGYARTEPTMRERGTRLVCCPWPKPSLASPTRYWHPSIRGLCTPMTGHAACKPSSGSAPARRMWS